MIAAVASGFGLLLAARSLTAPATGAVWAVANVVAARAAGPAASSRAVGVVGSGAMLANVVGVPLGAFSGQLTGWHGPFWMLAVLAPAAAALIARRVPHESSGGQTVSIRSEPSALRSDRLWLVLAGCATMSAGGLGTYTCISPLLTDRAGITAGLVPLPLSHPPARGDAAAVEAGAHAGRFPHHRRRTGRAATSWPATVVPGVSGSLAGPGRSGKAVWQPVRIYAYTRAPPPGWAGVRKR
ncbi:MFS transporter [Streptomyces sp. NPDC049590]|uniref:MFS transporter n=1 Tax=Streptomyces sp. NPDC049590 TaxID=3154834 RepID=UPI003415F614